MPTTPAPLTRDVGRGPRPSTSHAWPAHSAPAGVLPAQTQRAHGVGPGSRPTTPSHRSTPSASTEGTQDPHAAPGTLLREHRWRSPNASPHHRPRGGAARLTYAQASRSGPRPYPHYGDYSHSTSPRRGTTYAPKAFPALSVPGITDPRGRAGQTSPRPHRDVWRSSAHHHLDTSDDTCPLAGGRLTTLSTQGLSAQFRGILALPFLRLLAPLYFSLARTSTGESVPGPSAPRDSAPPPSDSAAGRISTRATPPAAVRRSGPGPDSPGPTSRSTQAGHSTPVLRVLGSAAGNIGSTRAYKRTRRSPAPPPGANAHEHGVTHPVQ